MHTDSIFPVLFELLIKSVLITLAAVLFARTWRGATSAQRHLIWLIALAAVVMLPLTRLVAPFWKIPLNSTRQVTVIHVEPVAGPVQTVASNTPPQKAIERSAVRAPLDWAKILLGLWLGGCALLIGYRLSASWRLHSLMRRSTPLEDLRVRLLLDRALDELHPRRRPEIRFSEECSVPITWGTLRPVILLPQAALEWSDTWLLAALRHEAAHIRRYDHLTRSFAYLACALYWPNPLVWLLGRSLRVAQEMAADDLVLQAGTPPEEYASQLVDVARAVTTHGLFIRQAVAMACPSTLEDRVRAIVDGRRDRRPLSRLAVACGSLTIALALGLSTAAQLRSDDQKPAAPGAEAKDAPVPGREIQIDAKFIELEPTVPRATTLSTEVPAVYSDPQFQVIIRALNQKRGVNMLSAPRVVTRSGQRAVVEVVRSFTSPSEWEKELGNWKPIKSETKNVGVTLQVEPRLKPDGSIELHSVATIVEFLGFEDLETGKPLAAPASAPNEGIQIPKVDPSHRFKPVFSERKQESTLNVHSGETIVIGSLPETADIKPFEKGPQKRDVLLCISPYVVDPASDKASPAQGAAQASPSGSTAGAGLPPIESATDAEFLRRVSLAITGLLPTPKELRAFLDDPRSSAEKRKAMIEKLTTVGQPATSNQGANAVADAESPALTKAKKIVIPKLELRDESLTAVVDYLRKTAIELDPETTGVNLVLQPGEDHGARITLSLTNVPLSEALRYAATLANLEVRAEPHVLVIAPKAVATSGNPPVEVTSQSATFDQKTNVAVFSGDATVKVNRPGQEPMVVEADNLKITGVHNPLQESAALKQAREIILPKVELREASLVEAVDFLRAKAAEAAPDKLGVNVVLKPGVRTDASITLSLSNISFMEALRYVATLANNVVIAEPEALVIEPAK